MYRNQFYYFSSLWPETGHVAVDEADILDILKAIVRHADSSVPTEEATRTALGVLTSLPRSEWAVSFINYLIRDLFLSLNVR
jgi:carnitine O-acetyltransferase